LVDATSMNAQEIVTETMAAEATILMARAAKLASEHPFLAKPLARIDASVAWLERELPGVLARLTPGSLSFLEVSAFCLCTHLPFREVRAIDDCPNLVAFARRFGDRESARATEYHFDVAQS
ncbi:MAG TPA: glutathione S-transferase domain-containing protein, partial [Polyangiaceae bacterium]